MGCLEAPGGPAASDRARGDGRGQRARPRLCLRRRARGVLRLCVTLAGVRAGAGGGRGGAWEEAGGGGGGGWALPPSGGHGGKRWAASAAARRASPWPWDPVLPSTPATSGACFALWRTSCRSRARPGPTTAHGYLFSQWWPRTPHLRAEARLGSPLATVCGSLLLPCFLASTLLASEPLERPPHFSGPQSLSVKWGQIAPSEMMPVRCDRQGLALGKARPKLLASVLVSCSGSTFSPRPTSPAPDVPAGWRRPRGRTHLLGAQLQSQLFQLPCALPPPTPTY